MKINYKGFEIEAYRAESMGAGEHLYYSVFRVSDGLEVTSGYSEGEDTPEEYIQILKETVEDCIKNPQDYE